MSVSRPASATHADALEALARGRRELSFTFEASSKGDRLALDASCVYRMVGGNWCLLACWLSDDDLAECSAMGVEFESRDMGATAMADR